MMMKEISLHVLDIVENSVSAGASLITVEIAEDSVGDRLAVTVADDGCGMDAKTAAAVISPFATSRTTRKVGLGIPFFKEGAEMAGGSFSLSSKPGEGTVISAEYALSHIDRPPLGNMAETMFTLVVCNPHINFIYRHTVGGQSFVFDTRQVRDVLGPEVPFSTPEVMGWLKACLGEGIQELNGGA